jgi:hypothetical protein
MASGALVHQRGLIMKSLHALPHATRIVFGALAAVVLLAATSAAAFASEPITSEHFAPGWQDHARSLINMGVAIRVDRTKWYVPDMLPRGEYVLVQRTGDKAEVIDGYRFKVRAGATEKTYLFLTPGYGDVQALPVADVPALNQPALPSMQK